MTGAASRFSGQTARVNFIVHRTKAVQMEGCSQDTNFVPDSFKPL
jgi:hypothetical protein